MLHVLHRHPCLRARILDRRERQFRIAVRHDVQALALTPVVRDATFVRRQNHAMVGLGAAPDYSFTSYSASMTSSSFFAGPAS